MLDPVALRLGEFVVDRRMEGQIVFHADLVIEKHVDDGWDEYIEPCGGRGRLYRDCWYIGVLGEVSTMVWVRAIGPGCGFARGQ
jgi:hypothetical protein